MELGADAMLAWLSATDSLSPSLCCSCAEKTEPLSALSASSGGRGLQPSDLDIAFVTGETLRISSLPTDATIRDVLVRLHRARPLPFISRSYQLLDGRVPQLDEFITDRHFTAITRLGFADASILDEVRSSYPGFAAGMAAAKPFVCFDDKYEERESKGLAAAGCSPCRALGQRLS